MRSQFVNPKEPHIPLINAAHQFNYEFFCSALLIYQFAAFDFSFGQVFFCFCKSQTHFKTPQKGTSEMTQDWPKIKIPFYLHMKRYARLAYTLNSLETEAQNKARLTVFAAL